jgi:hypothetical protein
MSENQEYILISSISLTNRRLAPFGQRQTFYRVCSNYFREKIGMQTKTMLRVLHLCILSFLLSLFILVLFARNPALTSSESGPRPWWVLVAKPIEKRIFNPLSIFILAVYFVHAAFFLLAADTVIEKWWRERTKIVRSQVLKSTREITCD